MVFRHALRTLTKTPGPSFVDHGDAGDCHRRDDDHREHDRRRLARHPRDRHRTARLRRVDRSAPEPGAVGHVGQPGHDRHIRTRPRRLDRPSHDRRAVRCLPIRHRNTDRTRTRRFASLSSARRPRCSRSGVSRRRWGGYSDATTGGLAQRRSCFSSHRYWQEQFRRTPLSSERACCSMAAPTRSSVCCPREPRVGIFADTELFVAQPLDAARDGARRTAPLRHRTAQTRRNQGTSGSRPVAHRQSPQGRNTQTRTHRPASSSARSSNRSAARIQSLLFLLALIAGLVVAMACANVSNVVLAQASRPAARAVGENRTGRAACSPCETDRRRKPR